MNAVLIPFAKDLRNGDLVELSSSDRSAYLDCVCPFCEQSVVPRLGDKRVWHFAHSNAPKRKPVRECDLSFCVCCRQFILEMASNGQLQSLRTPDYWLNDEDFPELAEQITEGRLLADLPEADLTAGFDLLFPVERYRLAVHLSYEQRPDPPATANARTGLLALDLGYIEGQYRRGGNRPGEIRRLVLKLFREDLKAKRWIYHPGREGAARKLERRRGQFEPLFQRLQEDSESPAPAAPALVDGEGNLTQEAIEAILREFRGPGWRR